MFIGKEIHIFHSSLLDSISSNQFLKQSLHADLEYIIKIALLRLLVFHNFVLNSLLIDYHTELIKLVQRSVQLASTVDAFISMSQYPPCFLTQRSVAWYFLDAMSFSSFDKNTSPPNANISLCALSKTPDSSE